MKVEEENSNLKAELTCLGIEEEEKDKVEGRRLGWGGGNTKRSTYYRETDTILTTLKSPKACPVVLLERVG